MTLAGRRVAILASDLHDDAELWYPYYRLQEEGAEVLVVGAARGHYKSKHGLMVTPDARLEELRPETFDCVVIPGGYSPDDAEYLPIFEFVRDVYRQGHVIALIFAVSEVPAWPTLLGLSRSSGDRSSSLEQGRRWPLPPVVGDVIHRDNVIATWGGDELPRFCEKVISALAAV